MQSVTSFYPVLLTNKVKETADFYTKYFSFATAFEADWYVSLYKEQDGRTIELAILDKTHETIPEIHRNKSVSGLIINIEVAEVDSEYERLIKKAELPLLYDIKSEAFGQRHFIIQDPNGVMIDVITPIEPSGEFVQ